MENRNQTKKENKKKPQLLSEFSARITLFISLIINTSKANQTFSFMLKFLEYGQILYFILSPKISRMWNSNYFQYLVNLIQYFNYQPIQGTRNANSDTIALIVVTALNLLILIILFSLIYFGYDSKKGITGFAQTTTKFIAIYIIIFRTLLTIPFSEISYMSIFCLQNDEKIASKLY